MKYHVIGYIEAEKKNPPRILMLANPVKTKMTLFGRKVILPTFDVQPDSVCFVGPHTLEWFDVIDKYQCDRDTNRYPIWEPDMSLFSEQEQIMSGQRLEGYLHKDLVSEINKVKLAKQQQQQQQNKRPEPIRTITGLYQPFSNCRIAILNGMRVYTCYCSKVVIQEYEKHWTRSEEGGERFVFPEDEQSLKFIKENSLLNLDPNKRQFFEPNLKDYYEADSTSQSPWGDTIKTKERISKRIDFSCIKNGMQMQYTNEGVDLLPD